MLRCLATTLNKKGGLGFTNVGWFLEPRDKYLSGINWGICSLTFRVSIYSKNWFWYVIYNHNSQKNRKKSQNRSENCWFLKVFEITGTDGSLILNCFGRTGTSGSLISGDLKKIKNLRVFKNSKNYTMLVFPVKLCTRIPLSILASFNTCLLNNYIILKFSFPQIKYSWRFNISLHKFLLFGKK
jgi:hypothetical protein